MIQYVYLCANEGGTSSYTRGRDYRRKSLSFTGFGHVLILLAPGIITTINNYKLCHTPLILSKIPEIALK